MGKKSNMCKEIEKQTKKALRLYSLISDCNFFFFCLFGATPMAYGGSQA